jgi:cysteine desulfurase/selenocysteine lyase
MYKHDFPIFDHHPTLVYLDSASTAQKPRVVIQALTDIYNHDYANIHRGAYSLSEKSELLYEASKEKLKEFLHAESRYEIVYTYSATYAMNYLARSLADSAMIERGDIIVLSLLDHHANIVPWQLIARTLDLEIRWIGVTPDGRLDLSDLEEKVA